MLLSIFVHTPNQTFNSLERFQKWHLTGRPAPPPILSFPFHPFRLHTQQDAGQRQKTFTIYRVKTLPTALTVQQVQQLETLSHDLHVEHVIVSCENCKQVGQQKQPKNNLQSLVWRCHSHCAHSFGHTLSKFFIAFDFFGHVQKNGPINQNYATQFPKN